MAKCKLKLQLVPTDDTLTAATPEAKTAAAKALSRQLRITAVTLLLTLGMIIAVTVAWFAMNKDVNADVAQVNIETNPNLVIKEAGAYDSNTDTFVNATASGTTASNISVAFSSGNTVLNLRPASHVFLNNAHAIWSTDWSTLWPHSEHSNPNDNTSAPDPYYTIVSSEPAYTGLKYNINPTSIASDTGLAKANRTPLFPPVAPSNDNTSAYYRDFAVQIASVDGAMPASALTVTMEVKTGTYSNSTFTPDDPQPTLYDYHNAASVDVYLGHPTEDSYLGTLNQAGLDAAENDYITPKTSVSIPVTGGEIPENTNGCITVTLRIYFDGALLKSSGHAYVYSENLSLANLGFYIQFEAEEPTD